MVHIKRILRLMVDNGLFREMAVPNRKKSKFEVQPRDYLGFAENSLKVNNVESTINTITHLKRALDCQVETFLSTHNLLNIIKKKRSSISMAKKLGFVGTLGLFSSESLIRLNSMRNKIEHEFYVPQISDLNIFFDLTFAFIIIAENIWLPSKIVYTYRDDKKDFTQIAIIYNHNAPIINIKLFGGSSQDIVEFSAQEDIEKFVHIFKMVLFLRRLSENTIDPAFFIKELSNLPDSTKSSVATV